MSKELRFLQITAKQQDFFYHISNDKNFIPKYADNGLTDSVLTSRTLRRLLEEKAPVNNSFCCYDNSDVIKNLVMTNFHPLI